jgi:hypothetical protein
VLFGSVHHSAALTEANGSFTGGGVRSTAGSCRLRVWWAQVKPEHTMADGWACLMGWARLQRLDIPDGPVLRHQQGCTVMSTTTQHKQHTAAAFLFPTGALARKLRLCSSKHSGWGPGNDSNTATEQHPE